MGIQAPLNSMMPPGFSPGTNAAWQPSASAASLMSELPNIPPPPFLNQAQPAGNTGGLGPLPDLPPPNQVAQLARSFPMSPNFQDLPELPPPHMAAPWIFNRAPHPQQPPVYPPQPQPWPPQPAPQPQPPQPPNNNNQQQPPQPPQPPQNDGPTAKVDGSMLNDQTIRSLNQRLNDSAENTRADAAIELFKILDKNPQLAEDPTYKPYVDAFMEKIIRDPSAVVRQAGELTLQLGKVKKPSQPVMDELQRLSQRTGTYNIETNIARDLLEGIQNGTLGASTTNATQSRQAPGGLQQPGSSPQPGGQPQAGFPQSPLDKGDLGNDFPQDFEQQAGPQGFPGQPPLQQGPGGMPQQQARFPQQSNPDQGFPQGFPSQAQPPQWQNQQAAAFRPQAPAGFPGPAFPGNPGSAMPSWFQQPGAQIPQQPPRMPIPMNAVGSRLDVTSPQQPWQGMPQTMQGQRLNIQEGRR